MTTNEPTTRQRVVISTVVGLAVAGYVALLVNLDPGAVIGWTVALALIAGGVALLVVAVVAVRARRIDEGRRQARHPR